MSTLTITPNFKALFSRFLLQAQSLGTHLAADLTAAQFDEYPESQHTLRQHAAVLRTVQGALAPLVICLESATSVDEIEKLRTVAAAMLAKLDGDASDVEARADALEVETEVASLADDLLA
jgi:hypothetical protein